MERVDSLLYRATEGLLSESIGRRVSARTQAGATVSLVYLESRVEHQVSDKIRKGTAWKV